MKVNYGGGGGAAPVFRYRLNNDLSDLKWLQ